jgi:glycosyltransferase involved in cell wall biosynthesis
MWDIVINLAMVGKQPSGMGRFARELLTHCEEISDFQRLPVTYILAKGNVPTWVKVKGRRCHYVHDFFSLNGGRVHALSRYFLPPMIPSQQQCIFTPFYQGCLLLKNQILTIHDVIPLKYPQQNKVQHWAYKYLLPILIKKALHIITVSKTTKEAIRDIYKVSDSKITVIYNAVNRKLFFKKEEVTKNNALLAVGAHLPHKNLQELLNNHDLWSSRYTLDIIAENSQYRTDLMSSCKELHLLDRVNFLSGVDDSTLVDKYRRARALIYPSLEEGFGIPPLEAMSTGTPVLVSDIPVHREVCADAAIYITPGDRRSWENAFRLLEDEQVVEVFVQRGLERAKEFSWQDSALRLTELLQAFSMK